MGKPVSHVNRVAAALLAGAWLVAGVAAIAVGLVRHRWIGLPLGLLSALYGVLWVRVAQTGRRIRWPLW
jgi:hypothetical protein